jgi:predicted ester cyclase
VNDLEFYGLEGAERSIAMYKRVLSDVAIKVEEQLVDGSRVTSRFVVTGTSRGRRVRFNGITISRFENGLIVEDWSVTDTLGMLRQLGLLHTVAVVLRSWRSLTGASKPTVPAAR